MITQGESLPECSAYIYYTDTDKRQKPCPQKILYVVSDLNVFMGWY